MTTKLKFLWVLLAMLVGGVNGAWAETSTLTFTTKVSSSSTYTVTQSNVTYTFNVNSFQTTYAKMVKTEGQNTLTISSDYFITGISVSFESGYGTNSSNNVSVNTGVLIVNTDGSSDLTWSGVAKSITITDDPTNGKDLRIHQVSVTYTTTDPSSVSDATVQTYPYTWDFNRSASLWASSLEQLSVFTDQWNHILDDTNGGHDEYRPKVEHTNWGYNIDLIKGLIFGNTNVWKPCLDYKNGQVYVTSGTIITIPSVKAGQIVAVTGNVTINSITNCTDNGDGTYTASNDGDVSITFGGQDGSWIKTISVSKSDVTLSVRSGSQLTHLITAGAWHFEVNVSPLSALGESASVNNASLFSVTSNDATGVMTIAKYGVTWDTDKNKYCYDYRCEPFSAGTANVVLHFAGNDAYNPADLPVTFTIRKNEQTLSFQTPSYNKQYGDASFSNTLTHETGDGTISYSSSNENVATVASDGTVTIHNPGEATITATAAETTNYYSKTASYIVTVNGTETPTITMYEHHGEQTSELSNGANIVTGFGNTVTVTGTSSAGLTVKYRSSDTRIATVNDAGVVTTVYAGSATIYVYTEGSGQYNPKEVSYNLTITATQLDAHFIPNREGYVNVGYTITPLMSLPDLIFDDIVSITAESTNPAVATVPADLMAMEGSSYPYLSLGENGAKIMRLLPIITGVSVGYSDIKLRIVAKNYITTEAVYRINVTDASTRNFSWADGDGSPTYKVYMGDYMKLPKILGNSNGNDNYSKGSNQKYIHHISNGTVTWNNKDYKRYEGVPDIAIVDGGTTGTNTDHAAIFWAQGQSSSGVPDTLMIYARAVGTVTIRAIDPQNPLLYCDASLQIVNRASLEEVASDYVESMKFPYTWDFTGEFDMSDISSNHHYWEAYKNASGNITHYSAGDGFFNVDWADSDNNGNYNERSFKCFAAGTNGNYMPLFYGLEMSLQSAAYSPKVDRIRIESYNSERPDDARLTVMGGTTMLRLPKAPNQPDSYKLFVKIKAMSNTEVAVGSNKYATEASKVAGSGSQLTNGQDAVLNFDIDDTSGDTEGTVLNLDNVYIYWIATSTEAKTIWKRSNTSCPAATYSYAEDLDFGKSLDANNYLPEMSGSNLKAYYASAVSGNSVTLTQVPSDAVQASQGLVLKLELTSGTEHSHDCYMIANPRNVDSYSTLGTIPEQAGSGTSNLLIASIGGETISGTDGDYHNFLLSYKYNWYNFNGVATQSNILIDDWAFYRIHGSLTAPSNNAYLHTTADSYYFNPTTARRLSDEPAIDDEKALNEKNLLYLTFVNRDGSIETTAIDANKKDNILSESDVWYTLQGVPVATPPKGGIYIHNGRKVVVK